MKRRKKLAWYFNSNLLNKNTYDYYAVFPLNIFVYEGIVEMKKNYKQQIYWLTEVYEKYQIPETLEEKWEKRLNS